MSSVDAPIREADPAIRFANGQRLREHVEKHLLRGGLRENWPDLADRDWIEKAKAEGRRGEYGEACLRLAAAYERFLSAKLSELCREERGHLHFATLDPERHLALWMERKAAEEGDLAGQDIEGWDFETKLIVVAACHVRNGRWGRYILKTGYRVHPGLDKSAFARKIAEMRAKSRKRRDAGRMLMAEHDNDGSR